jgi:hypothetical protein
MGGWALMLGGILLYVAQVVLALVPAPPAEAEALSQWVATNGTPLSVVDELLAFATVCLAPATVVLVRAARPRHPFSALAGGSTLALALVVVVALVLIDGRLVYPVFGIALSPEVIALLVSTFFGGSHTLLLLLGAALLCFAACARGTEISRWVIIATAIAGALQIAGSFPWITPPWWSILVATALVAWMLASGWWLLRRAPATPEPAAQ